MIALLSLMLLPSTAQAKEDEPPPRGPRPGPVPPGEHRDAWVWMQTSVEL